MFDVAIALGADKRQALRDIVDILSLRKRIIDVSSFKELQFYQVLNNVQVTITNKLIN